MNLQGERSVIAPSLLPRTVPGDRNICLVSDSASIAQYVHH